MAEKVIFNGAAKTITIKAGFYDFDVMRDFYMASVDWIALEEGNQWLPPFRSGGRIPTNASETQFTASYVFIINGWTIVAATGENVSFQTNLYPDPNGTTTSASMFTVSNNTVISNRQSDSPVVASELELALEYGGVVYIDSSVTETGSSYPYGTSAKPVNNALDAKLVGELYGISNFALKGTLYLAGLVTLDNFEIHGAAGATVWSNGQPTITNGQIYNCNLAGDIGLTSSELEFINCHIAADVVNLDGIFKNCGFEGRTYIADNCDVLLKSCYTKRADSYHVDFNFINNISGGIFTSYEYSGRVGIEYVTHVDTTVIFGFASGDIEVYPTCTAGAIRISGIPFTTVDNQTGGMTVNTSATLASQLTLDAVKSELTAALETIDYDGTVHVKVDSLNTGTAYPVGTGGFPVNNLADALTIMSNRGLSTLKSHSDFTIDQPLTSVTVTASNPAYIITIQNVDIIKVIFEHVSVGGTFGTGSYDIIVDEGVIEDGTVNLSGFIDRTRFKGEFFPADNAELDINDSLSVIPGTGSPTINFANVLTLGRVSIRRFAGGLRYENMTIADIIITAAYSSGKAHIENSNTAGYISVRGLPDTAVNDNRLAGNTGLTIDVTGVFASGLTLETALQAITYNGRVVIDNASIYSGTVFPVGTDGYPVNNIADAVLIAERENIKEFYLVGNVDITQDIEGYRIIGNNGGEWVTVYGVGMHGVFLENVIIGGAIDVGTERQIRALNCQILPDTTGLSGVFKTCGFMGNVQFDNSLPIGLLDCFPVRLSNLLPDPVFSFGDGIDDTVSFNITMVNFVGGATFANSINAANFIELNSTGGNLVFDSSNTAGTYRVTGIADNAVTDNTNGATVLVDTLAASAVVLNEALEKIDYSNKVVIDVNSIYTGQLHPIGTNKYPVNNLADAHQIAETYNLYRFEVRSDLTIDEAMTDGYVFYGKAGNEIITLTGVNILNMGFENVYITGDAGGVLTRTRNCKVNGITNWQGAIWDSIIFDDIHIVGGSDSIIMNSYTMNAASVNENTGTPTIFLGELLDGLSCNFNVRGWHGPIQIANIDNQSKAAVIHATAGFLIIDSTCTDGYLFMQGFNPQGIVDLSSGTFFSNKAELSVSTDDESRKKSKANLAVLM
jgi:hypothetical protein